MGLSILRVMVSKQFPYDVQYQLQKWLGVKGKLMIQVPLLLQPRTLTKMNCDDIQFAPNYNDLILHDYYVMI